MTGGHRARISGAAWAHPVKVAEGRVRILTVLAVLGVSLFLQLSAAGPTEVAAATTTVLIKPTAGLRTQSFAQHAAGDGAVDYQDTASRPVPWNSTGCLAQAGSVGVDGKALTYGDWKGSDWTKNGPDGVCDDWRGSRVNAALPGYVSSSGVRDYGSDGKPHEVRILHGTHDGKTVETRYLHMGAKVRLGTKTAAGLPNIAGGDAKESYITVPQGRCVLQGDQIGSQGYSGKTTATHLHFVLIIGGVRQDPEQWIGKSFVLTPPSQCPENQPPVVPNPPSGLTAATDSASSIRLSWTDNSTNEDGFRVYRQSGSSWVSAAQTGPGTTSHTVSGLSAITSYRFQVRAYNGVGESSANPEASATTSDPTVTGCSPNSEQVAIFEHPNYQGACAYLGIGDYAQPWMMNLANDSLSSLKVGSQVRAVACTNDSFNGSCSPEWEADIPDVSLAGFPHDQMSSMRVTKRTVTGCSPNSEQVAIFEHPNYQGACAYLGIGEYTQPWMMNLANDSLSSLKVGSQVRAVACTNDSFNGSCSPEWEADIPDVSLAGFPHDQMSSMKVTTRKPATPAAVVASSANGTAIRITWGDVAGEAGYEVSDGTSSRGVPANTTTFDWTGLLGATQKCFTVRAVSAAGDSDWSTPGACATTDLAPPSAVTATGVSNSRIMVLWNSVVGQTGYEITDGVTTQTAGQLFQRSDWDGLSWNTTKCFRVRSLSGSAASSWTSPVCAATRIDPPLDLSVVVTGSTSIRATWSAVPGAIAYHVSLSPSLGPIVDAAPGTMNVDLTPVQPNTTYCVSVMAYHDWNYNGTSSTPYSPEQCVTTPPPPMNADLNGDGKVSSIDMSILLSNMNRCGVPGDINKDGCTDTVDLSILLSRWGTAG